MERIRAFLALELPAPIQRNLRLLQDEFSFLDREIKWVKEANLHITLHFFGSLSEREVGQACSCAGAVARDMEPFPVEIKGLGVFPPWENKGFLGRNRKGKGRITGIAHPFGQRITKGRFCPGKKSLHTPCYPGQVSQTSHSRCPLAVRDKAAGGGELR